MNSEFIFSFTDVRGGEIQGIGKPDSKSRFSDGVGLVWVGGGALVNIKCTL